MPEKKFRKKGKYIPSKPKASEPKASKPKSSKPKASEPKASRRTKKAPRNKHSGEP